MRYDWDHKVGDVVPFRDSGKIYVGIIALSSLNDFNKTHIVFRCIRGKNKVVMSYAANKIDIGKRLKSEDKIKSIKRIFKLYALFMDDWMRETYRRYLLV
jgi:hypothetical protein